MDENNEDRIIFKMYDQLDNFQEMYKDGKFVTLPKDVKITVYCNNGSDEEGFIVNQYENELGMNAFIAKKWIMHSVLEELIGEKIEG